MKLQIKRGDEVVVLSGSQAWKRVKGLEVHAQRARVIVEGVNVVKKHMRKTEDRPQGGIVEREAPLHVSKLMLASTYEARRARRGAKA